ncbi:MAG TPA: peroxiredoxin-like family protein [Tepidisphaeraceae bacterium]|nr:peroxiredoxin-like family protein [Tepidisphaeraceae bacterium]
MQTVPADILHAPVTGRNLRPGTLGDQLGDRPTLLAFLRHFGCPFCKETVTELKRITAEDPAYPPVLFVSQCAEKETAEFFAPRWDGARVVCDPDKTLYYAMGLRRGGLGQIMGLRVWACSLRALRKGHMMTVPVGDPWLMPGAFVVAGGRVLWAHNFEHQGDLPDWTKIPQVVHQSARVPDPTPTPDTVAT